MRPIEEFTMPMHFERCEYYTRRIMPFSTDIDLSTEMRETMDSLSVDRHVCATFEPSKIKKIAIEFLTVMAHFFSTILVVGDDRTINTLKSEYHSKCFYPDTRVEWEVPSVSLVDCSYNFYIRYVKSLIDDYHLGKETDLILYCGSDLSNNMNSYNRRRNSQYMLITALADVTDELGIYSLSFEFTHQYTFCDFDTAHLSVKNRKEIKHGKEDCSTHNELPN